MSDRRDLLDHYAPLFPPPEQPFDGLLRRRDRKRRNNRIAAGVVGLAVGLVAVLVGTSLLSSAPAPAGPTPTSTPAASAAPTGAASTGPSPAATQPAVPGGSTILRPGETLQDQSDKITAYRGSPGTERVLVACKSPCRGFVAAMVSADGRWLAYEIQACSDKPPCDPETGIWLMDPSGERRQVTSPCLSAGECALDVMAWSPEGATLAVFRQGDHPQVLTIDPATGQQIGVADTGSGATVLAWLPDSSRIAYATKNALHAIDLATGESSVLATGTGAIDDIEWSPDGTRIAYDTTQDGRNRIVVMGGDGSNAVVLVDQGAPQGPGAPRWSPDGTRIAYVTTPGGFTGGGHGFSFEVWVIGADASAPMRLFHGRCCIEDWRAPVWSPDGMQVAFWDDVDGSSDLSTWLATQADGSGAPQQIPEAVVQGW